MGEAPYSPAMNKPMRRLPQKRSKNSKIAIRIAIAILVLAVVYWLRPIFYPLAMRFYVEPLVWLLPLLIFLIGVAISDAQPSTRPEGRSARLRAPVALGKTRSVPGSERRHSRVQRRVQPDPDLERARVLHLPGDGDPQRPAGRQRGLREHHLHTDQDPAGEWRRYASRPKKSPNASPAPASTRRPRR